jgi:putative chitinase
MSVQLTEDVLLSVMPHAHQRAELFLKPLQDAVDRYFISDSHTRIAMFLASIAEESGELRYTAEIASGSAYEGRADLGNTEPGDGVKFKGRGLIQITGKANYTKMSQDLYGDDRLVQDPTPIEEPELAALSAAWFWDSRSLNFIADGGMEHAFLRVSERINGINHLTGLPNHWAERCFYWDAAKKALEVTT